LGGSPLFLLDFAADSKGLMNPVVFFAAYDDQVVFAIVEGNQVFVMHFELGRAVHDLSVHKDTPTVTFLSDFSDGVEPGLGFACVPVVVPEKFEVLRIDQCEAVTTDRQRHPRLK